jgi:Secretion system C-terminal sorting domain
MKKRTLLFLSLFLLAFISFIFFQNFENQSSIDELREQHQSFLDSSPFNKTINLSKKERKAMGLPPNGYNEQIWELTLDPNTGRPMPERVLQLQQELRLERENNRGVGGDASNPWVDRGPNNIGGRTRGIMFDPNDTGNVNPTDDYTRVFAGGVSGGLWVNNDITDANSSWTLVPGIGANIAVTVIISDPNNLNTFYIGAGESYTSGQAVGRGIWKSTDAGVTWSNIFGGYTGFTPTQLVDGIFYINDLVARDIGATTELYAAVAGAFYGSSSSPSNFNGLNEQGLYKSTNNGTSWSKFTINESGGSPSNPNDIELDINNNIWFTTTRSSWGFPGGKIFRSTNGTSFTLMTTIAGADRTEIETSQNSANTLWVLANVPGSTNQADIFTTTDAFTTAPTQILTEPADADTGIPNSDFTRGQAFYDLEIEADASGNLLVGGVDLFRSTDNGATWSQISKWSNNNNLAALGVSLVHADQQGIVFRPGPGNDNKFVFGTDGGVYYCDDITVASTSTSAITARNKDYNTVQYYYGDISSVINLAADDIIGGTQDNGTPAVYDGAAGPNPFTDLTGGDGGYTEIDDAGAYIITAYPNNNHYVIVPPSTFYPISSGTGGSFINEGGLDKNLDILYCNASTTTPTYSIERNATFTTGAGSVTRTSLTDALLDASPSAFKVSPFTAGSTKLFVGLKNGKLLRLDTADGTPTWNNITGGSFVGSISDIEFGQSESEIFVTIHNYGVTSIWFTSDGGTSWASKEGNLPDLPVKCILQNPLIPNEVIVGTELGVWATANYTLASPVWVQSYNGMSDVTVIDLDLRTSDNVVLATTHGRGMFTSQFTSTPLALDKNDIVNNSIKVFPTLSKGEFSVMSKNSLGIVDMEIYTITGQRVYKSTFELSNVKKSFSLNLNSGLYLIKIQGTNFEGTKRLIIK